MDDVNHNTNLHLENPSLENQESPPFHLPNHQILEAGRSKTSLRMHYEAQAEVIRKQIGSLEEIRLKLGLSARKLCQLIMVDPSAWTRWTKHQDQAPPHVWRALQWYLIIQEKIPGLTPQYFVGKDPEVLHQSMLKKVSDLSEKVRQQTQDLETENQALKAKIQKLEYAVRANKITAIMIGLSSLIMAFAFYRILKAG